MSLAVFLGAGFSKWAADLPLARDLFDFDIEPWPREEKQLNCIRSLKERWDVVHPNGLAEQFVADILNSSNENRATIKWYLSRRLSELFIWQEYHHGKWRRHSLMIDENRRFRVEGVAMARDLLQRFAGPHLAGIVTTNYDLLVEYALGTKGFNYGIQGEILRGRGAYPLSQWRNPIRLRGQVSLAKIHGSISWDEHGRYTDGRRGLSGQALIVAPTPEKEPPRSLERDWTLASRILHQATRLLVFGFAFNPYDEAVLTLLSRAGQQVESVLLVNRTPNSEPASRLWPRANITTCQPPPEGDSVLRSWLSEGGPRR